jgi:hypothetical protein
MIVFDFAFYHDSDSKNRVGFYRGVMALRCVYSHTQCRYRLKSTVTIVWSILPVTSAQKIDNVMSFETLISVPIEYMALASSSPSRGDFKTNKGATVWLPYSHEMHSVQSYSGVYL